MSADTIDQRGAFALAVAGPDAVTLHLVDAKGHVLPATGDTTVEVEPGVVRRIAIAADPRAAYPVDRRER